MQGTEGNFSAAAFQLLCTSPGGHCSWLEGLGLIRKVKATLFLLPATFKCHLAHSTFNSLVPSTVFFPKLTNAWMPSWMGNSLFPIDSHLKQFLLERIPLNQAKCVHSASIYILGPCSPYPFPTPNPQSCWSHDRVLQIFKNNLQVPSNPAA